METMFRNNAMKYVHWIAEQINLNRHLIPSEDLFYESATPANNQNSSIGRAFDREIEFLRHGEITTRDTMLKRSNVITHKHTKLI